MNIYEKLLEVQKQVSYLQKENTGFQFKYVSSSQTLGAVRNEMDKQGLILSVEISGHVIGEKITKAEGVNILTELDMIFTWINAEKPEEKIVCPFYAQGLDSGEKGVGKALTYGEKFFILKFFHIATDKDDPDAFQRKHDAGNETTTTPKSPAPPKQSEPPHQTPPGSGQTATIEDEHKKRGEIVQYCLALTQGDMEQAKLLLEKTTRFTDKKTGKEVAGITNTAKLTGKRLDITHSKLHKMVNDAGLELKEEQAGPDADYPLEPDGLFGSNYGE